MAREQLFVLRHDWSSRSPQIPRPVIFLFVAGRTIEPTRGNQSYFVGHSASQFLLPKNHRFQFRFPVAVSSRAPYILEVGSGSAHHEVLVIGRGATDENGTSLPQSSVHMLAAYGE
jgi:hypothetical protein